MDKDSVFYVRYIHGFHITGAGARCFINVCVFQLGLQPGVLFSITVKPRKTAKGMQDCN